MIGVYASPHSFKITIFVCRAGGSAAETKQSMLTMTSWYQQLGLDSEGTMEEFLNFSEKAFELSGLCDIP